MNLGISFLEKETPKFKPAVLCLKIDIASNPTCGLSVEYIHTLSPINNYTTNISVETKYTRMLLFLFGRETIKADISKYYK